MALAHGILLIKITTDPVEIWAAPKSRSRIEKQYYDSRFEPFYRTEQIIFTSVGLDEVSQKHIIYIYMLCEVLKLN